MFLSLKAPYDLSKIVKKPLNTNKVSKITDKDSSCITNKAKNPSFNSTKVKKHSTDQKKKKTLNNYKPIRESNKGSITSRK